MKTPTQMKMSSASAAGIVPSATLSATALATACCAGPNICTACLAPLIVTLLNKIVEGLTARLGARTARRDVKPSLLLTSALAKALSAALPRGPMMRSIWATSLPSPTSDSPTRSLLILAMEIPPWDKAKPHASPALQDQADWLSLLSASRRSGIGWPDSHGGCPVSATQASLARKGKMAAAQLSVAHDMSG